MEVLGIFTAFGLSASAGLNAYIPLLAVALLARFTHLITLKAPWDGLTNWWIIGILIFLSVIEFVADKIPAVDHVNDVIMTFIRPAAGAIVFAASTSVIEVNTVFAMAMGLLVAGSVHAVKARGNRLRGHVAQVQPRRFLEELAPRDSRSLQKHLDVLVERVGD